MASVHATAAILSVGDELTLGQTLDTNGKWLAERLTSLGIIPARHLTVPDSLDAQTRAFQLLAEEADVVVCTGGLGPTADDLTRQALAEAMHDSLVEDTLALAQIEAFFAARNRPMSPLNRSQALRPARGQVIPNLNGTAPGLIGSVTSITGHECDAFCLPGPPKEMVPMFEAHVIPRLRLPEGRTVRTRVLHSFGLGESDLAQRLGALMHRGRTPLVGTTASGGVVSIRLRYEGHAAPADAESLLDDTEQSVREAAGEYIFAKGDHTLQDAVLALLRARAETLGTVESCTGGGLGEIITRAAGSSSSFLGSLVTYSNELKTGLAGVPADLLAPSGPGAVSAETAKAMAEGGLSRLNVSHCLSITGIAGPDGARPGKPVGTVFIARASKGAAPADPDTEVRRFQMTGDRQQIREWSARTALAMLWQHLSGLPPMKLLRET
ncbi:MAG: CinA family nicotinamide mononucleotide deamidase-related protein [Phycisphaerales bacterium]